MKNIRGENTLETQTKHQNNPLGYAPVMGLIGKFAIPSIISLLVASIYNITDQAFIGHIIGIHGNAATSVAFPTLILATAFSQLIAIGTASNFNINQGRQNHGEAARYIETGLALLCVMGMAIFSVVFLFKKPILLLCGATETVMPYALPYLTITAFGLPFHLFSNASSAIIRSDGSPTYSMTCMIFGAVLNIFLDWLFMFIFNWGIEGAAFATSLSQFMTAMLCIRYYFRFNAFKIHLKNLKIRSSYAINIFKLGLSNFINQIVMMIVNIVLNNTLTKYGAMSIYGPDIPLAVAGVAAKINSIIISFSVGLSQGCQPIWSYNMGAKQFNRVKEAYFKGLMTGIAIGAVGFTAFHLFPQQILSLFGSGNQLYFEFGALYLKTYLFMVTFHSVQAMTVNYFTGTGHVKSGILMSLSRQGFFLLPVLIALPMFFGIKGALYAGPIADTLACLLAAALMYRNFKNLK